MGIKVSPDGSAKGRQLLEVTAAFGRDAVVNARGEPVRAVVPVWVGVRSGAGDEAGVKAGAAAVAAEHARQFVGEVRKANP